MDKDKILKEIQDWKEEYCKELVKYYYMSGDMAPKHSAESMCRGIKLTIKILKKILSEPKEKV